jgi:hypothetical protein
MEANMNETGKGTNEEDKRSSSKRTKNKVQSREEQKEI